MRISLPRRLRHARLSLSVLCLHAAIGTYASLSLSPRLRTPPSTSTAVARDAFAARTLIAFVCHVALSELPLLFSLSPSLSLTILRPAAEERGIGPAQRACAAAPTANAASSVAVAAIIAVWCGSGGVGDGVGPGRPLRLLPAEPPHGLVAAQAGDLRRARSR